MPPCWGTTNGRRGKGDISMHMCVFIEPVLTQTQPLHCPPQSLVRMFEGCLASWLPLISAGTKNPAAGRLRPLRDAVSAGTVWQGRLLLRKCGAVNYRLLMSCFKTPGSEITQGITVSPPSNPLI